MSIVLAQPSYKWLLREINVDGEEEGGLVQTLKVVGQWGDLNQNITDEQIALHKATLNKCIYNVQAPPAIAGKMKACFMTYHAAGQNEMNTLVAGCMAKETGV